MARAAALFIDEGVDANEFYPVSIEQIKEIFGILPLIYYFCRKKNLIEPKLIDGIPANITVGMPFYFIIAMNIFGNCVKNIQ